MAEDYIVSMFVEGSSFHSGVLYFDFDLDNKRVTFYPKGGSCSGMWLTYNC